MAEHTHGEMDIKDHEKMFAGFMRFTSVSVTIILVLVILMAIFIT